MLNRRTLIASLFAAPFLSLLPYEVKSGICEEKHVEGILDSILDKHNLYYFKNGSIMTISNNINSKDKVRKNG